MNHPTKFFIVIAVFFCMAFGTAFGQAGAKEAMSDPYREAITTARMEIWKAIGSGMTSSATVGRSSIQKDSECATEPIPSLSTHIHNTI